MQNNSQLNDEIDLREIFSILWEQRKIIIKATALFALSAIFISLFLTNYYRSEALMVARSDSQNQNMLSQVSGLASFAGLNIGLPTENKALEAIEIINSRKFVRHLITFEGVLPAMMAPYRYDKETMELVFDSSLFDTELGKWVREPNENGDIVPTYLEAHAEYIENLVSVSQDTASGFINIYVEHISPVFAKEFLELIIREANVLLRKRDIQESSQALDYLKSELTKTSFVEIKESINNLIEGQMEKQMLAQINEDYILIEIDPPFIAEKKSKPSRLLIVVLGSIVGFIIVISIILIRHYFWLEREKVST